MIMSLVYDGHVRSVGSLGLNVFVTFTIACSTEFPADTLLIVVLDRWGRRWLACGTLALSGIFSLLSTLAPPGKNQNPQKLSKCLRFSFNFLPKHC